MNTKYVHGNSQNYSNHAVAALNGVKNIVFAKF